MQTNNMEYELVIYLKKKKFSMVAPKSSHFNVFFEQLYSNECNIINFQNITFAKSEFCLAVIKEKKRWLKRK